MAAAQPLKSACARPSASAESVTGSGPAIRARLSLRSSHTSTVHPPRRPSTARTEKLRTRTSPPERPASRR